MKIDGYQIGGKVSSGRFCDIYNALEDFTSNTVNVYLYHHSLAKTPEYNYRFKLACNPLVGQSIGVMVPIKLAEVSDSGCYVISDHFPSFQRQAETTGEIGPRKMLEYGMQLAFTLDQLHQIGEIHGGVELTNLYFPDSSHLVLGLVAFHRTLSENLFSTISVEHDDLSYLAPEVVKSGLTNATDFYALGVVLFELMFKRKPFLAEKNSDLLRLQFANEIQIPDERYANLLPLFKQLLNPKPEDRISNAEQFQHCLIQCGLKLDKPDNLHGTGASKNSSSPLKSKNRYKGRKKYLGIVATIIVVLVGISFYLTPEEDNNYHKEREQLRQEILARARALQPKDEAKTSEPEEIINNVEVITNNPPSPDPKAKEIAMALYQSAMENLKVNNLGGALILVNNALKEDSTHQPSQQLKQELEQKISIRSIIQNANRQLTAGKIDQPEGDNVLQSYRLLARKLGNNHPQVKQGYEKIANYYFQQARVFLDRNQFERSRTLIASGLSVKPGHNPLVQLRQEIKNTEILLQQQQHQQIQQQEAIRFRKQQELDQQKQREIELAKLEQQALQETDLLQQKINGLITQGELILAADSFSLYPLSVATDLYYQAAILEPRNSRALELRQKIANAYANLANRYTESDNLLSAEESLTRGLELDNQHPGLLQVQKKIKNQ